MATKLAGKIALITGGSSGLGLAIASEDSSFMTGLSCLDGALQI